jgi:ubiquinone/menaquinone biosynthesis C-methylase UbiE
MAPELDPPKITSFENDPEGYDKWFDDFPWTYKSEVEAVNQLLPPGGIGLDIGTGGGRFAEFIRPAYMIEPSLRMRQVAEKRGLNVEQGRAENLHFDDNMFDYVTMITVTCFLDSLFEPFHEVYRVLKPGGCFINAFVDEEPEIGQLYRDLVENDPFLKESVYHSKDEIFQTMKLVGFGNLECRQTVLKLPSEIEGSGKIDDVIEGHGEGLFVVVRGEKPLYSVINAPLTSEQYTLLPNPTL